MAVTNIRETYGRVYSDTPTEASAVRVFRVTTDTATYFLAEVADDPVMAQLGEFYSLTRTDLRCTSREISEVSRSNTEFTLTMRYTRYPFDTWDVKLSSQQVEQVLEKTATTTIGVNIPTRFVAQPAKYLFTKPNGDADEFVMNRAKDAFDPPVSGWRTQIVINAETMVESITDLGIADISTLYSYVGKVNSERVSVFGIPDDGTGTKADYWTLLLDDVTVTNIKTPTLCALLVQLRIVYDPLSHCPVILNAGYHCLVEPGTANERKLNCKNTNQVDVSVPVPLTDAGAQVAAADLPAAANYIVAPNRQTFDFSLLGLPTAMCSVPTVAPTGAP